MKIVLTALIVVLVSVSVVSWAWFQGVFDAPRVRMIRMATAMDTQALRVAGVIEKGVSAASESLIFAAAQTEFDIAYGNRSVTLAWYLIDQRAFVDPRHAYFDWKEDSETVAPAFDEMLNLELPERHRANAHSCAGNQYGAPDQACGNHLGVH